MFGVLVQFASTVVRALVRRDAAEFCSLAFSISRLYSFFASPRQGRVACFRATTGGDKILTWFAVTVFFVRFPFIVLACDFNLDSRRFLFLEFSRLVFGPTTGISTGDGTNPSFQSRCGWDSESFSLVSPPFALVPTSRSKGNCYRRAEGPIVCGRSRDRKVRAERKTI